MLCSLHAHSGTSAYSATAAAAPTQPPPPLEQPQPSCLLPHGQQAALHCPPTPQSLQQQRWQPPRALSCCLNNTTPCCLQTLRLPLWVCSTIALPSLQQQATSTAKVRKVFSAPRKARQGRLAGSRHLIRRKACVCSPYSTQLQSSVTFECLAMAAVCYPLCTLSRPKIFGLHLPLHIWVHISAFFCSTCSLLLCLV